MHVVIDTVMPSKDAVGPKRSRTEQQGDTPPPKIPRILATLKAAPASRSSPKAPPATKTPASKPPDTGAIVQAALVGAGFQVALDAARAVEGPSGRAADGHLHNAF